MMKIQQAIKHIWCIQSRERVRNQNILSVTELYWELQEGELGIPHIQKPPVTVKKGNISQSTENNLRKKIDVEDKGNLECP